MYYLEQESTYAVIWSDESPPIDGDETFTSIMVLYGHTVAKKTTYKKKDYKLFFDKAPHSEDLDELLGIAALESL